MLPAVTNASILSLLEILMGPFIQLESLRINLTEPAEKKQVKVETRNWHRDMWALSVGQTKSYQPPHACNVLTYFQKLIFSIMILLISLDFEFRNTFSKDVHTVRQPWS